MQFITLKGTSSLMVICITTTIQKHSNYQNRILEFIQFDFFVVVVVSKTFFPRLGFCSCLIWIFMWDIIISTNMYSCVQRSIDLFIQPGMLGMCCCLKLVVSKYYIAICRAFRNPEFWFHFLVSFFLPIANALISIWPQCHDIWSISDFRLLFFSSFCLSPASGLCRLDLVLRFFIYFTIKSIYTC